MSNAFFQRHAASYATSESHATGDDLLRLIGLLSVRPGEAAIDVATGTGHTAFALAAHGARVTGIDPTPAMRAEAEDQARKRGLVIPVLPGTAEALPLPDGCADIVTCRRAAHHFSDIPRSLGEMARVLRPGGRLGLADMCPEPWAKDARNAIERLRDATHIEALDEEAWRARIATAGLELASLELSVEETTFTQWMRPLAVDSPEAQAVRAAVRACPTRQRQTICRSNGEIWLKRRVVILAVRPKEATR